MNKQTAYQFFRSHAGYSYDPKRETRDQGRRRCARNLAQAEHAASDAGISFEWSIDEYGEDYAGEFSSGGPYWQLTARDDRGRVIGSLGGVDFGAGVEPWGHPYRRVCEAEIALSLV